jgi:YaiO family outer membrane protein
MKSALVFLLASCFCLTIAIPCQGEDFSRSEIFQKARSLAFQGDRAQAMALCREILEEDPGDRETKTLLARINAWEGNYPRARELLQEVVEADPEDRDARGALIDVELWSGRPKEAWRVAQEGLDLRPANPNFLVGSARALSKLGLPVKALADAREAVAADPQNVRTRDFYRLLLEHTQPNRLSADYRREWFNDSTDPWEMTTLSYRREFGWGSIIPRLNIARRFNKNDVQFELDSYPKVGEKMYAYLNFGVSGEELFPQIRYGAELYRNFPKAWEASLGFRRLEFESGGVTIYTGTIARYIGKFWIQFRPQFVTKNSGDSFSGRIRIRRFLNGRYEYIELSGGAGDDLGSDLFDTSSDLDSSSVQLTYRRRIRDSLVLKTTVGIGRENLSSGLNRDGIFFRLGLDYLF